MKKQIRLFLMLFLCLFAVIAMADEEPVLMYDYQAFSVGFQGLYMDEVYGNTLLFSFTNQLTETLMVSIDYILMDSVLTEPFFADMIEPGETRTFQVVVESATCHMQGWVLTQVVADLWVYSAENIYATDLFHDEITFLPQGESGRQNWKRNGSEKDVIVLDNALAKMTVINASRGQMDNLTLTLHTMGKSTGNLMIRVQKVWINGTPFDVYYTGKLIARSQTFSKMEILDGLTVLLNLPGSNEIRMIVECLERSGQKSKLLMRETVTFSI